MPTTISCITPLNSWCLYGLSKPSLLRNFAFWSHHRQWRKKKLNSWSISAQPSSFDLFPPPIDHDFLVISKNCNLNLFFDSQQLWWSCVQRVYFFFWVIVIICWWLVFQNTHLILHKRRHSDYVDSLQDAVKSAGAEVSEEGVIETFHNDDEALDAVDHGVAVWLWVCYYLCLLINAFFLSSLFWVPTVW